MSKDRYQVITYCNDSGADDKLEYSSIRVAEKAAREYVDGINGLSYDGRVAYTGNPPVEQHNYFWLRKKEKKYYESQCKLQRIC